MPIETVAVRCGNLTITERGVFDLAANSLGDMIRRQSWRRLRQDHNEFLTAVASQNVGVADIVLDHAHNAL